MVLRNFPLVSGHGFADYLLSMDGKAAGIIETKNEGVTLIGVEVQADKLKRVGLGKVHRLFPEGLQ